MRRVTSKLQRSLADDEHLFDVVVKMCPELNLAWARSDGEFHQGVPVVLAGFDVPVMQHHLSLAHDQPEPSQHFRASS